MIDSQSTPDSSTPNTSNSSNPSTTITTTPISLTNKLSFAPNTDSVHFNAVITDQQHVPKEIAPPKGSKNVPTALEPPTLFSAFLATVGLSSLESDRKFLDFVSNFEKNKANSKKEPLETPSEPSTPTKSSLVNFLISNPSKVDSQLGGERQEKAVVPKVKSNRRR
jgi:hypothetical protein